MRSAGCHTEIGSRGSCPGLDFGWKPPCGAVSASTQIPMCVHGLLTAPLVGERLEANLLHQRAAGHHLDYITTASALTATLPADGRNDFGRVGYRVVSQPVGRASIRCAATLPRWPVHPVRPALGAAVASARREQEPGSVVAEDADSAGPGPIHL